MREAGALERGERDHQLSASPLTRTAMFGAMLAGAERAAGANGLPGTARPPSRSPGLRQSFGAFAARGMTITLEGYAHYVGKGLPRHLPRCARCRAPPRSSRADNA
jgi:glutamate synthase (NADPH/NADH) large chain